MQISTILRQIAAVICLSVVTVMALGAMQGAVAQSPIAQFLAPADEPPAEPAADAPALGATEARLLVDLLRDEAAREALITGLEQLSDERAAEGALPADPDALNAEAGPAHAAAEDESTTTFGRQLAKQTQAIAKGFALNVERVWMGLIQSPGRFTGLQRITTQFLLDILAELAFSIAVTVGVFLALRQLVRQLYQWLGRRSAARSTAAKVALYLISLLIDAAVVLTAWAAGYALTMAFFGEFGDITIRQTLYLNAFLAVETVKLGMRAILSPSLGQLRPVDVGDEGARRSYRVLNIVTSIIGYGQLLIVPIVARQVGYFAGRSVSTLLLLIASIILALAVLRNRHAVADWMLAGLERRQRGNEFWRRLVRLWWVPVLLYLLAVLVIVLVEPGNVLMPVLAGSARILVASAIGWTVAGLIGFAIARGVRLPIAVNRRLPMLERRLNTFIPRALLMLRLLILLVVAIYAMHVARLIDAHAWLESAGGLWLTGTALSVMLILLVAFIIWVALASWVDYRLNLNYGPIPTARESTLLTLLRSAATVTLIIITLMLVLSEIGVDIAPLIASAGIVGLAIGFGAQKLVQDIITGLFIQLENAINVGDVVTAGDVTGVAERLTIRSVALRDFSGVYHIVPFSSVDTVSNFMRDFAYSVIDMEVAHRVDVKQAQQAMFDAFEELRSDPDVGPTILDDLEWYGLNNFVESGMVLRARIKTLPGSQWATGRAYNGIVKRIFDERGIELIVPHRMLYAGQGRQGEMRLHVDNDTQAASTAEPEMPVDEGDDAAETGPDEDRT